MIQLVLTLVIGLTPAPPGARPKKGDVEVSLAAESPQSAGCPIVLDLKLKNVGKEEIAWWCGGPARYPGAEHFVVEVRYGSSDKWKAISATNGQYTEGSGRGVPLAPGQSIVVPLAVPIEKTGVDDVAIRVTPRDWIAAKPAEAAVLVFKSKYLLDRYQAGLIAAAIRPEYSFQRHLAQQYPDNVVIDSLIKMLDTDNEAIVAGIADVLWLHKELPATAGESLAKAVREWVPKNINVQSGGMQVKLLWAALRTQSEPARVAVLEFLTSSDMHHRAMASDALSVSPGDLAWLRRARAALVAAEKDTQKDADAAKAIARGIKWLDARIQSGDR